MSTPSHNANNSSETHTDKRQTRDPNQRETDIASQPHLSKIAGIGASLARFPHSPYVSSPSISWPGRRGRFYHGGSTSGGT